MGEVGSGRYVNGWVGWGCEVWRSEERGVYGRTA